MGKTVLKWVVALVVGGVSAGLAYITGHTGTGPGIDPWIAGIVVGVLTRAVGWVASKVPAAS